MTKTVSRLSAEPPIRQHLARVKIAGVWAATTTASSPVRFDLAVPGLTTWLEVAPNGDVFVRAHYKPGAELEEYGGFPSAMSPPPLGPDEVPDGVHKTVEELIELGLAKRPEPAP